MDWAALAERWIRMAERTEASHSPVEAVLLARAGLAGGQHVLDIGFGTGATLLAAAKAVGPAGRVTGIDIAAPLVDHAVGRVPGTVSLICGNAEDYPFDTTAFDAAISMFGMMFFSDHVAAFTNIRAALRPGGRLTFVTWADRAANPWFVIPARAAEAVLGPSPPADPLAPGPFAYADAARVLRFAEAAGWQITVETHDVYLTPAEDAAMAAEGHRHIGPASRRLADAEADDVTCDAVIAGITERLRPHETAEGLRVPARVHVFHAVNPG